MEVFFEMSEPKKIEDRFKKLSEAKQTEVLDFVDFLEHKETLEENSNWSRFSLRNAIQKNDPTKEPVYTSDDIIESI
jgi:hypothetical protein